MAKIESDETLVRRFHAGDDSAFDVLCERYRKSVYTSCYAILVGEELATDVASQTFTEAMRELRNGHVPADPHAWLRGKARRLAIDRADPRMERRSRSVDIDPEWQAAVGERGQLVWDAVTSLSLSHRKVLNLRIPLELSTGQIAEVLHIEVGVAQRLMADADRELRAALVALIVARTARRECGALDGLLAEAGWTAGHFHAESRTYRTVADHIGGCGVCVQVRARTYLASDWLRVVIPLLAVPEELVRRLIEETQEMAVRAASTQAAPAVSPTSVLTPLSSTGASLSQPLNKLVQFAQTGRAAISVTTSRLAASPIFTKAANLLQENPVIARTASLAATLVLLSPLVLAGSEPHPDPHRDPDIVAEQPPPTTTSPAPEFLPDPPTQPPPPASENPPAAPEVDPASYVIPQDPPAGSVPPDPPPPGSQPPDSPAEQPPVPPSEPPTEPPTSEPPTSEPPTSEPPTSNPPPPPPAPPKWGYAWGSGGLTPVGTEKRINTNYSGSWKSDPDPVVASRLPVLSHDAAGSFRYRFPAIGSTKAVAHVSVAWGAYSDSCVITDLEVVDGDEVVHINCYSSTGTPRDANFAVLLAEPGGTQPMATVQDDATNVRHTGTGSYTVVLDGKEFAGLGYAQVTAKGAKPARCQNAGVHKVGGTVEIALLCHAVNSAAPLTDTEWMLTYTERGPLNPGPGVPAVAYVQTTFTAPGLRVDQDRSYNSTGGAMTVLRDGIGRYRVGFKGVGIGGNVPQVIPVGPELGECNAGGWSFPAPGEVWVTIYCYNNVSLIDRPFGVALVRPPGGAAGTLEPAAPGPHPAGPKWAHARVGLETNSIPLGIETEVRSEEQWGTWVRNLSEVDARWARRATVIHEGPGLYRVRLPGVGSAAGIPHLTVSRMYTFSGSCAVRGYRQVGVDEEITVACFYGAGGHPAVPANLPFSVFFSAPPASGAPAATIRYPVSTSDTASSTGGSINVEHTGTGTYVATVDGSAFDGTGLVQVTPYLPDTPAPVWCRGTGTERIAGGMRISISCWDFSMQAQPRDAQWLLTYTQGSPLSHDPGIPGAYLRTTLDPPALTVDPAYSYNSTGGEMRVLRLETGRYWVGFRGIGQPWNTFQVSMVGPGAGQCLDSGSDHFIEAGVVWIGVSCFNSWRSPADLPFSVAALRAPYGVIGALHPTAPGPHPPVPRWGYAYLNAIDLPLNAAEVMLNPAYPWGSWLGSLDPYMSRWWAPSTVIREGVGVSRVRLPGIGSANGIPHVSVIRTALPGEGCVVQDYTQSGVDELIRVRCFDKAGHPKDIRFFVYFGEVATTAQVTQLGTGHYLATLDASGLAPNGYAQLTPLTDKAVRCRNAGVDKLGTQLRIDIRCHAISADAPLTDSGVLVTYVQGTTLSRDPRLPGAYAQTTTGPGALALDTARSYNSTGGSITFETVATGQFRIQFAGIGRIGDNSLINGQSAQLVLLGSTSGSCYIAGAGHLDYAAGATVGLVLVNCYDTAGNPANVPFGVAYVRRP